MKKAATTTFNLDLDKLPPLIETQQAELKSLSLADDSQIDYTDIPAIKDTSHFYRPVKEMTTIRLDADVLAWLRSQGKGYQTKINAILRREMLAASKQ